MHRRRSLLFLVLAGLMGLPSPGMARQAAPPPDTLRPDTPRPDTLRPAIPGPDTTLFRVQGITVQSRRPVATAGGTSGTEVELGNLVLPPAPTADEVLREIGGVQVRTNSRGQSEISVRGSESRQVAVLFDGIPLTLAYDARTDVSVLPAAALREIRFVRGLSTLLHGPNVLGGVVEMNAARGSYITGDPSFEISGGFDHVGSWSGAAHATRPFETVGGWGVIRGGVGFRDSPGIPLPGRIAEPVSTGDALRLNTDFRNVDAFGAFRYTGEGGAWTSLSATTHRGERGIAAELAAEDPRFWRYPDIHRTIVAASLGTGDRITPVGRGRVEGSLGYDAGITDIRSYTSRAYEEVQGTEDGDHTTLTLRLLGTHSLGSRGELRTSFTRADIRHNERVDGAERAFQQELTSLASESTWRLLDRPGPGVSAMRLSFGGAYDRGTTPLSGGLPSLPAIQEWGARVGLSTLVNGGHTMLHVGASRRGRFPALREMYSEALNRFAPNPDLRPETLVAVEGGVTTRLGPGELQVVGFHHTLSGAIRRIALSDGRRQRVNADQLTGTGLEVLMSTSLGRVQMGGEVSLQAVRLSDPATPGNQEPENVPARAGSVFVRLPTWQGVATTLSGEFLGHRFCIDPDSGADVKLGQESWFDAAISRVWTLSRTGGVGRRMETTVAASNVGNATLYDSCGLPRAGRLLRLQFRVF